MVIRNTVTNSACLTQAGFIVRNSVHGRCLSKYALARQVKAYLSFAPVWRKRCVITLSELQSVIIDEVGGYKFIVAKVSEGEASKLVVRANANCSFHRDILGLLRHEASNLNARCIGGGNIEVDPTNKVIKIWGSSGDFGVEPNRAETVKMLNEAFLEFKIESTTPNW